VSAGDDTPRGGDGPTGKTPATSQTVTGITPLGLEPAGRLCLLVISDRQVATHTLPESGEVAIGRSPKADVLIDDPSISRTHALLTIASPIRLRDLGSANGTRVRDRVVARGESTEVAPGDVIQIGAATLIIQRRSLALRAQRIWAHDYFEVRLEEECARAARTGAAFALMRLRCAPPVPAGLVQEALAAEARASDVVGEYGPSEYEILLVDTGPDDAARAVERITGRVRQCGAKVEAGLACFPRDGRNPDELIARAASSRPPREPAAEAAIGAVIVADRRMRDLYRLVERIAAGSISVLILGETGVGKEVLAERVHQLSPRAARPYLRLNCAALSETLLESELFGHERGAFTGAVAAKPGLLETADGGTVFLDEIGELPMELQPKLLRALESREVRRLGASAPQRVDVRIVAATNRSLVREVDRGRFREDLYYRLAVITVRLPPLRERPEDIPLLVRHFEKELSERSLTPLQPLPESAVSAFCSQAWPGNARELRNAVDRAFALGIPEPGEAQPSPAPSLEALGVSLKEPLLAGRQRVMESYERAYIELALRETGGNISRAAALAGVGRKFMQQAMKRYGLRGGPED
jgi:DNA-binding NtrC family response regulator